MCLWKIKLYEGDAMKVVLLEENRLRRDDLHDAIAQKGNTVLLCPDSSSFMEAVYAGDAECYVIDVRSWFRGESIFSYYSVEKRMKSVPALFYNSPEGFSTVEGREPHPQDIVLEKEKNPQVIADRIHF